jgi:hypothetical protein
MTDVETAREIVEAARQIAAEAPVARASLPPLRTMGSPGKGENEVRSRRREVTRYHVIAYPTNLGERLFSRLCFTLGDEEEIRDESSDEEETAASKSQSATRGSPPQQPDLPRGGS